MRRADNFAINYPGCTELRNLTIGAFNPESTITNLTGLNQITSVISFLYIRNNPGLVSLNGLENLVKCFSY